MILIMKSMYSMIIYIVWCMSMIIMYDNSDIWVWWLYNNVVWIWWRCMSMIIYMIIWSNYDLWLWWLCMLMLTMYGDGDDNVWWWCISVMYEDNDNVCCRWCMDMIVIRYRHKENMIKMWVYLWELCVTPEENCS